jgi:predicted transcriptional regulator of viral defense system
MAKGLMTYKEAEGQFGSQYRLKLAVENGEIFKIESGVYSRRPDTNEFEVIGKRYPHAIFTGETAHYLHGLTDVIPDKIHLATKRNATRINDSRVTQLFVKERLFEPGGTAINYDGSEVRIYDKERLLVELLRKSHVLPFDYYKELIANYRKIAEDLDFYKIEEYVNLYKRSDHLFNLFQREVL